VAEERNIVLIGMPGAGKSTVGTLLAESLARSFLDTDTLIQTTEGRRLQEIIDAEGLAHFREIEARHVLSLRCGGCVIATGGSVIYSAAAMAHLKSSGLIVYLDLSLSCLEKRLRNLETRGIVMIPGQTLRGLYEERLPLYGHYADLTIECDGLSDEQVAARIIEALAAQ